jgi:hypothetical protein
MAQGALGFQYELETTDSGLTALGGLPLYLDLARVAGLADSIDEHVGARRHGQGWTDAQMVLAGILLQLSGGDCVDDLERLQSDGGFALLMRQLEWKHLPRWERRDLERRFRKGRERAVPSPSAMRRYLQVFHDPETEEKRLAFEKETGRKAFIPAPNECLRGLRRVNRDLLAFLQVKSPEPQATLDLDASLVASYKQAARFSYKGGKAFQPLQVWWAEQQVMVLSEFRDGNVPAGHENLRVLQESLDELPPGVDAVRLRSDTAGYQWEILHFCERGQSKRFGRIEFAVGCDVSPEFKAAVTLIPESDWYPIYRYTEEGERSETGRQWAEVDYAPAGLWTGAVKTTTYRFLATREPMEERVLPEMPQPVLPFPIMDLGAKSYKVHGIVTNLRAADGWEDGEDIVAFLYQRCGKSEEAHSVLKEDLGGGKLPSQDFGANAAWWWMSVLALNLNSMLKRVVLGGDWSTRRLKALRFHLIHIAGRVVERARQLILRLASGAGEILETILQARTKMLGWATSPPG